MLSFMTLSLDRIDFTVETKPTNITKLEISNSLSFCARALLIVTINYVETPKKHLNSLFWKNHKKTIVNHVGIFWHVKPWIALLFWLRADFEMVFKNGWLPYVAQPCWKVESTLFQQQILDVNLIFLMIWEWTDKWLNQVKQNHTIKKTNQFNSGWATIFWNGSPNTWTSTATATAEATKFVYYSMSYRNKKRKESVSRTF